MTTPAKAWRPLVLPPDRYELIDVRLPDSSVKQAVWTGAQWWCDGHQVQPTAWRPRQNSSEIAELRSA